MRRPKLKWFKHSSTALNDAKIEKLIMKYGIEGYGVYFAIVEMIAQEIDTNKVSCELEHDYELLAYKFRVDKKRLEEAKKNFGKDVISPFDFLS